MTDLSHYDKRRFHRIFYKAEAELSSATESWPCQIQDLSLNGCMLIFSSNWDHDKNQSYTLTWSLSEEIKISMALSPSHCFGDTVGFKCIHIDFDSISELRRLVELNLGDSDMLERDLQALIS